MAVKSKADLQNDIDTQWADNGSGNITPAILRGVVKDIVDSYEDFFPSYSTAARNALTGVPTNTIIFNVDTLCLELYVGSTWVSLSNPSYFPLDCSTNPNYPEGIPNIMYYVSVAGRIGGGSGKQVNVGDLIFCKETNGGGNEATVGSKWLISYNQGNATNSFSDVLMTTVNISAAQIANAHVTPVNIQTAGGAGTLLLPFKAVVQYTYNTAAYNIVNAQFKMSGASNPIVTAYNMGNGASSIAVVDLANISTGVWLENAALELITSADAGSTGQGTMKVQIYYKVHTL